MMFAAFWDRYECFDGYVNRFCVQSWQQTLCSWRLILFLTSCIIDQGEVEISVTHREMNSVCGVGSRADSWIHMPDFGGGRAFYSFVVHREAVEVINEWGQLISIWMDFISPKVSSLSCLFIGNELLKDLLHQIGEENAVLLDDYRRFYGISFDYSKKLGKAHGMKNIDRSRLGWPKYSP